MSFTEYFYKGMIEYPRDIAENPIPWEVFWEYVSSTFLDGFINYCTILDAYIINRYNSPEENKQNYEKIKTENPFHLKFSKLNDDVLILGKLKDGYIFFWFDRDVSDCCIGKFRTHHTKEVVHQKFIEYVESINKFDTPTKIDNSILKGWLSW